jgi:hypothetical protein
MDKHRVLAKRRQFQLLIGRVELDQGGESVHGVPEARHEAEKERDRAETADLDQAAGAGGGRAHPSIRSGNS